MTVWLDLQLGESVFHSVCLHLTRRTWARDVPVTLVRCLHPGSRYRLGSRFRADGNPTG